MTTNNDVKWYERLIKVERKVDDSYNHSLALHEKLGEVFRGVAVLRTEVRNCTLDVQALRKQLNATRKEMDSVPDLMAEVAKDEITKSRNISELKRWRRLKGFFKSGFGKGISELVKLATIAAIMYALHRFGVLGK